MRRAIAVLLMGTMILASGCSEADKGTVYEYDEPEVVSGLVLTKSVYDGDTLTIYHDGTIDDDCEIDCGYAGPEYEIDDECIVITGDNIEEITSINIIRGQDYKYALRYLDSNQYAVLAYAFATEIGWDHIGWDVENYYTAEELDKMARDKEERQAAFESSWEIVEGYYEAEDGRYIEFFIDDNGTPLLSKDNHNKVVVSFGSNGSSWVANCIDDPYDYEFDFELADDASYMVVTDYSNREDVVYYRK